MNHQKTYDSLCVIKSEIINLLFQLIPTPEIHAKAMEIYAKIKVIAESEHNHIINEIQNQPIAEWKP